MLSDAGEDVFPDQGRGDVWLILVAEKVCLCVPEKCFSFVILVTEAERW